MKEIYLTQESKQEIEAKINELEKETHGSEVYNFHKSGAISVFKEILLSATILPVEESWDDVLGNTERDDCVYSCKSNLENGVIIQPKQ
jgi:hypothetical protein